MYTFAPGFCCILDFVALCNNPHNVVEHVYSLLSYMFMCRYTAHAFSLSIQLDRKLNYF